MNIRHPMRAGAFYEESPSSCRHHATKLIEEAKLPEDLPDRLFGGLVPHAGWMYSGKLAALTFKALAASGPIETVVLFGADHVGAVRQGEVYDSGVWRTPLGDAEVDADLAAALLKAGSGLRANPQAHAHEHSLEVQVPLLQVVAPAARIVPIAVPPTDLAVAVGEAVGKVLAERYPHVQVVGSTDLTHHGGHFPAPGGHHRKGVEWTVANDQRMIRLVEAMEVSKIIPEARERSNACGAGAVAATVAACRALGARRGLCLQYTNSYEIVHAIYPSDLDDTTVGYASVVFA